MSNLYQGPRPEWFFESEEFKVFARQAAEAAWLLKRIVDDPNFESLDIQVRKYTKGPSYVATYRDKAGVTIGLSAASLRQIYLDLSGIIFDE